MEEFARCTSQTSVSQLLRLGKQALHLDIVNSTQWFWHLLSFLSWKHDFWVNLDWTFGFNMIMWRLTSVQNLHNVNIYEFDSKIDFFSRLINPQTLQ